MAVDNLLGVEQECLADAEDERADCFADTVKVAEGIPVSSGSNDSGIDFGCPNLTDESDVALLRAECKSDPSLKHCRELADSSKIGYFWRDGLLYHKECVELLGSRERIVIPSVRRNLVLKLAHDHCGHFGGKK